MKNPKTTHIEAAHRNCSAGKGVRTAPGGKKSKRRLHKAKKRTALDLRDEDMSYLKQGRTVSTEQDYKEN